MRPSSQEPSVKMLGDARKGIPAEAPSICGTTLASAGMGDTELPKPALNSAWSAGSLAQPGSVSSRVTQRRPPKARLSSSRNLWTMDKS